MDTSRSFLMEEIASYGFLWRWTMWLLFTVKSTRSSVHVNNIIIIIWRCRFRSHYMYRTNVKKRKKKKIRRTWCTYRWQLGFWRRKWWWLMEVHVMIEDGFHIRFKRIDGLTLDWGCLSLYKWSINKKNTRIPLHTLIVIVKIHMEKNQSNILICLLWN